MKGLEVTRVRDLCLEVFDEKIRDKIRPKILETIRDHKSRGACVVLLSSATDPICTPVSEYLEMDDLVCSILEQKEGKLTGTTTGTLVYGKEKEVRMRAYCREHGFDPAEAYYYGDSFTDEYVMMAVGHPVAVDPDKKLLKTAQRHNWSILLRERA